MISSRCALLSLRANLRKVLGVCVLKGGPGVCMGVVCKRRRCCVVFCGEGMVVAVFFTIFQYCVH